MNFSCEQIGLNESELQDRIVSGLVDKLLLGHPFIDSDGDEVRYPTELKKKLDAELKARIDAAISSIAETHILPNAETYIENITLQATTAWGEPRGEPMSFTEYMTSRAESYMLEDVNYNGQNRSEATARGLSWIKTQSRISHLVHAHLQTSIDKAVKQMLANVNKTLVEGIKKSVEIKLSEISK